MTRRIVVKVGSNVLTRPDGKLDVTRVSALVDELAWLRGRGCEVILVSSGAVASGHGELGDDPNLDSVEQRQLYSAVGQVKLINTYYTLFREYGIGTDEAESPVPEKIEYRDREVVVIFRHADGLTTRDGKPVSHLQLAGADGVFRNACGDIQGERLTVTSAEVEKPKAIRFGWDKLANPNLINCLNVPVAPFSAVQGRNEE